MYVSEIISETFIVGSRIDKGEFAVDTKCAISALDWEDTITVSKSPVALECVLDIFLVTLKMLVGTIVCVVSISSVFVIRTSLFLDVLDIS